MALRAAAAMGESGKTGGRGEGHQDNGRPVQWWQRYQKQRSHKLGGHILVGKIRSIHLIGVSYEGIGCKESPCAVQERKTCVRVRRTRFPTIRRIPISFSLPPSPNIRSGVKSGICAVRHLSHRRNCRWRIRSLFHISQQTQLAR